MKFISAAAIAMAALVSAQTNGIPSCALPCLDDAVKKSTSCSTTDYSCICKDENFSKVQGAATSCVVEKCGSDVALNQVLPATQKLCASAGTGGGSAPASSAAEPTEMASETAAEPTEMASETAAEPTEMAQPTESEPAGNTACPTTMVSEPCPPTNATTPPTTPPVTAGAAGFAPLGGLALLAIGALAL